MFSAPARWLLLRDGRTIGDEALEQTFRDVAVYPDSEVTVASSRLEVDAWQLTSVYRPSPFHVLLTEDRGTWTASGGVRAADLRPTSRRRRDLRRTALKSCLVVHSFLRAISSITLRELSFTAGGFAWQSGARVDLALSD